MEVGYWTVVRCKSVVLNLYRIRIFPCDYWAVGVLDVDINLTICCYVHIDPHRRSFR